VFNFDAAAHIIHDGAVHDGDSADCVGGFNAQPVIATPGETSPPVVKSEHLVDGEVTNLT